ncbi:MAG: hypothetical protein GC150_17450 [Rhizobiales bacterium]|nr:hypothetical protein [Hyphomicrobiales bacterium]
MVCTGFEKEHSSGRTGAPPAGGRSPVVRLVAGASPRRRAGRLRLCAAGTLLLTLLGILGASFTAPVLAQSASARTFEGRCHDAAAWSGHSDGNGSGYAAITPCNEEEPAAVLSLACEPGTRMLKGGIDFLSPDGQPAGPIPVTITIDGEQHLVDAIPNYLGLYERLEFPLAPNQPVVTRLMAGRGGTVAYPGRAVNFHLKGSRRAIETMLAGCDLTTAARAPWSEGSASPPDSESRQGAGA